MTAMPLFRIFYTLHKLTPREEEKCREANKDYRNTPFTKIHYQKEKKVIERKFATAEKALAWADKQREVIKGIRPPVFRKFTTVFGVCEAKDGECLTRLETAWNAEQMELL